MSKSFFSKPAILIILTSMAFFPFFARATVYVSEVAWMGTTNSANDEWMELHNDGSESVDLSGWTLSAVDGVPNINFSSTTNKIIPAGGFYLMERTDDNAVLSITADLIYTGALSNDGEDLVLRNKDGNEIDRVNDLTGWRAGDNVSKQTMQKTAFGWVAATGTPKAVNSEQASSQSSSIDSSSSSSVSSSQSSSEVGIVSGSVNYVFNSEQISAKAGEDRTAIAGADIVLEGKVYGFKNEPIASARYFWTLGDGSYKEGQNIRHIYKYPGNYIAVLNASSGDVSASDGLNIKVIPNELRIVETKKEFIKLKNESSLILDLSGWFLKAGGAVFKFPDYSLISASAELIIPSDVSSLKFSNNDFSAEILYPNGSLAFSYKNSESISSSSQSSLAVSSAKQKEITSSLSSVKKENVKSNSEEKSQVSSISSAIFSQDVAKENNFSGVIAINDSDESWNKWWLMLAGIIGIIGAGGVFLTKKPE